MDIIKTILFGIVQGITEWLPISSTGHMILLDEFVKLDVSRGFWEMFLVVIQFGSILAVVSLYFNKLNPFSSNKKPTQRQETLVLWIKVLVACLPAGILGILFDDFIDEKFYNFQTVAVTLILYGILFIVIENNNKAIRFKFTKLSDLTYSAAFFIGCVQVLALVPGTSRSGSTILGAMLIGTSRYVAAEFSFFLAIPVMLGASSLKILKFGFDFNQEEISILIVGMITAFLVSIVAIKFLMEYIKKHNFKIFGWYRIFLGIIILWYFIKIKQQG